jgi:hypothetical protein
MAKEPETAGSKLEMQPEISALIGSIAKAFAMPESEAVEAVEQGAVTMDFSQDDNGNRFIAATYDNQTARIYQGAIKYAKASESEEGST